MDPHPGPTAEPLEGKTYSLCASDSHSDNYFRSIHGFAEILLSTTSLPSLLGIVQQTGKSRRQLRSISRSTPVDSMDSHLVQALRQRFSQYTPNVAIHLKGLSLPKRWDRTLTTTEEQYHLFMLEIELANRLHISDFRWCDVKMAFLPHCLHDLSATCRSTMRGEDYVCKGCSRVCCINAVSKLLRRHGISPYIWKTARLEPLFKRLRHDGKTVGVVGIACIPELVNGMRRCARAGVPAVGIPLNANRCARWWGEFYPNSVNLQELENLLGHELELRPAQTKKAIH